MAHFYLKFLFTPLYGLYRGIALTNKQIIKFYYYIESIMITLILFSYSIRKFSLVLVLFFVLAILVAISKKVTYSRFKIRKARYYNNQKLETFGRVLIFVGTLIFIFLDGYYMIISWMLYMIAHIILEKPKFD